MMKRLTQIILLLFLTQLTYAQLDEKSFDFWVGNWNLTWEGTNGAAGKGTNQIVKILDDKVIQEHFTAVEGLYAGMKGTSISVYNPQQKTWHQTWQDNQGGNIVLTGRQEGAKKYFETVMTNKNQSRMVFYDFTDTGFTWDWEATQDEGESWQLNWRIRYSRAKK